MTSRNPKDQLKKFLSPWQTAKSCERNFRIVLKISAVLLSIDMKMSYRGSMTAPRTMRLSEFRGRRDSPTSSQSVTSLPLTPQTLIGVTSAQDFNMVLSSQKSLQSCGITTVSSLESSLEVSPGSEGTRGFSTRAHHLKSDATLKRRSLRVDPVKIEVS